MKRLDPEIEAKYEVLAIMGEGGMGAVYKVRHRHLDEIRVIKLLRDKFRDDENLTARFLREAKTAVKLRHPNIAEVIDFDVTSEGTAYIVMEFLEGVDLRRLVANSGDAPDVGFVVSMARQTLAALAYLHARGFIHRDISPDNLMLVNRDGHQVVKLIDLGIAKSVEASRALTKDGHFIGKVQYASPEQLVGAEIDARSDLYSLGVVLYEMLTGAAPITGSDYHAIIAGHLGRPPRDFAETDPGGRVPPALRRVILKSLEKERDRRFATADAFSAALEAAERESATTSPDRAETEHISERTTLVVPVQGRPRARALIATTAAASIALVVGALWLVQYDAAKSRVAPPVAPPVSPAVAPGQLLLKGLPWAEVVEGVDERGRNHVRDRPLYTPAILDVPPGNYRVVFSNPFSGRTATVAAAATSGTAVTCAARVDDIDAAAWLRQVEP